MAQAPASLPFSSDSVRVQLEADERLKSALLSRFVLAGLSEADAHEATNFVAGVSWLLVSLFRVKGA